MRPGRCIALAILGATVALALAACSSGGPLNAGEPTGKWTVSIPTQTFPASQTLSEHTHLVLQVRNMSSKPMPNVAITICNVTCRYNAPAGEGTSVQPFAQCIGGGSGQACLQAAGWVPSGSGGPGQAVASLSRQVWVVDKPPGPCTGSQGYSCAGGSFGAYTSLDANTWATNHPLAPGATATFDWAVSAVAPGHYTVAWVVSAGLAGEAKAVLANGQQPSGTFPVTIKATPQQSYVNNNGQIVNGPSTAGG